jgi:AbrB family looped-hinge helix DNA binding protein
VTKVTSKLQITLPKAIADRLRIRPGDRLAWTVSGSAIQAVPVRDAGASAGSADARLKRFDEATRRHAKRRAAPRRASGRGWTREDLYAPHRGRAR